MTPEDPAPMSRLPRPLDPPADSEIDESRTSGPVEEASMPDVEGDRPDVPPCEEGEGRRQDSRWSRLAVSVLVLFLLGIILALVAPAFEGKFYAHDDVKGYSVPFGEFYARCLKNGEDFLWCPNVWCGYYLGAENRGMHHPLQMVLFRAFPLVWAVCLEFAAVYALMIAGMYIFLKRWGLDTAPALLASITYAFSGFNLHHYVHITLLSGSVHLPYLLLAIDFVMRSTRPREVSLGAVGLAFATASESLMAHPQMIWTCGLAEAGYALILAFSRPGMLIRLPILGVALAVGVLGGAAQLLPTYDLYRQSHRATVSREFLASGSMSPINLPVQSLSPSLYRATVMGYPTRIVLSATESYDAGIAGEYMGDWRSWEFGMYNGAITPALLVWSLMRWRHLGRLRLLAGAGLIIGGVGLLLTFGDQTPLFELMCRIPAFNMFRAPGRYRLLYNLSADFLVAISLADLSRSSFGPRRYPWWRLWPLALVALASLVITLGFKALSPASPRHSCSTPCRTNTSSYGGRAWSSPRRGWSPWRRGYRGAILGLVVLAALDTSLFARRYFACFDWETPEEISRTVDTGQPLPAGFPEKSRGDGFDHRLALGGDQLWCNGAIIGGVKFTQGYTPFRPNKRLNYSTVPALRAAAPIGYGAGWGRIRATGNLSPIPCRASA